VAVQLATSSMRSICSGASTNPLEEDARPGAVALPTVFFLAAASVARLWYSFVSLTRLLQVTNWRNIRIALPCSSSAEIEQYRAWVLRTCSQNRGFASIETWNNSLSSGEAVPLATARRRGSWRGISDTPPVLDVPNSCTEAFPVGAAVPVGTLRECAAGEVVYALSVREDLG
jgi:hypothetical protein